MATTRKKNRRITPRLMGSGWYYRSVTFVVRTAKGDVPVTTKKFGQEIIDMAPGQDWRLIQKLTFATYDGAGDKEPGSEQIKEVDVTAYRTK